MSGTEWQGLAGEALNIFEKKLGDAWSQLSDPDRALCAEAARQYAVGVGWFISGDEGGRRVFELAKESLSQIQGGLQIRAAKAMQEAVLEALEKALAFGLKALLATL